MRSRKVVLEAGAEGGGITLSRVERDGRWEYFMTVNESYLDDEDSYSSDREVGSDIAEAFAALDRYPWHRLYPVEVDPDFAETVYAAVKARGGPEAVQRWREILESHRAARARRSAHDPIGDQGDLMSLETDDLELERRVAALTSPEACEQFAKNQEARGKSEIALLARRKAIELHAESHGAKTDAEREALEAVYAYERTLFLKHGKRIRASRTWRMIDRRGIIAAVESVVTRSSETTGYTALASIGLHDKAFEAVVVRHPHLFSAKALERSRARLSGQ